MTVADDPLPLMFDVHPGRVVIAQGEPYPDAWVVRYGALLMELVDPEGHRLALDLLGPGDLVGGPVAWTADASVRALVHERALRGRADRPPRRPRAARAPCVMARMLGRLGSDRGSSRGQAGRPRRSIRTAGPGRALSGAAPHAGAPRRADGCHQGERQPGARRARGGRTRGEEPRTLRRSARPTHPTEGVARYPSACSIAREHELQYRALPLTLATAPLTRPRRGSDPRTVLRLAGAFSPPLVDELQQVRKDRARSQRSHLLRMVGVDHLDHLRDRARSVRERRQHLRLPLFTMREVLDELVSRPKRRPARGPDRSFSRAELRMRLSDRRYERGPRPADR